MTSTTSKKIVSRIPLSEPKMAGNEWAYIKECLDTNWVSSAGKFVDRFEKMIAEYVGMKYAVACVNGTAALHMALVVAGVKANDEVLVPALTFAAPAFATRYIGAWPTFIDVDKTTCQLDPEKVRGFLSEMCEVKNGITINRITKRLVRAIIPVHLLGHPVDMDPILELAKEYGLAVIEDAAESLGAKYKGDAVGKRGDIACFSFNGNKIITTGGGGMIVTDNKEWAERARYLTTQAKDDPIEYIHNTVGYNYRLTNIQAAMGVAQMEKIDEYVLAKRCIATRYAEGLGNVAGIKLPTEASWAYSTFWLYTIMVDPAIYGMGSRDLMKKLSAASIDSRPLWHPLHTLVPFVGCAAYQIQAAEWIYEHGLSLPSSVGLRPEDQQKVIYVLRKISKKST
ncbi:MAG: LegC family aminotransferase [bacterium]|nr:LegC family aminotransferase [bacterium]